MPSVALQKGKLMTATVTQLPAPAPDPAEADGRELYLLLVATLRKRGARVLPCPAR